MAFCEISSLQNTTAVDSAVVAEMKAVGSADCNQPSCTEPTAKPLPFKDPSFMVSLFSLLVSTFFFFLIFNVVSISTFGFFLGHVSTLGLVEQRQVKRTGLGKTSNRFWPWSELYRGSLTIQTVSQLCFWGLTIYGNKYTNSKINVSKHLLSYILLYLEKKKIKLVLILFDIFESKMPFFNRVYRLQYRCSAITQAKQKIFRHLWPPSEL